MERGLWGYFISCLAVWGLEVERLLTFLLLFHFQLSSKKFKNFGEKGGLGNGKGNGKEEVGVLEVLQLYPMIAKIILGKWGC